MVDKKTKLLLAERKQTLEELKRLRSYMEVGEDRVVSSGEDSVDAAADVYEREKTLAIIQTLEKKVASIERALRAAEKGSYGICEVCSQPINPARLEVMPHTTTCVTCQARLERMPGRRPIITYPREEE